MLFTHDSKSGVLAKPCTRAAPWLWRDRDVLGDGLTGECPQDGTQGGGCTSALPGRALPVVMGRDTRWVCACVEEGCPVATGTAQGELLGASNQPL